MRSKQAKIGNRGKAPRSPSKKQPLRARCNKGSKDAAIFQIEDLSKGSTPAGDGKAQRLSDEIRRHHLFPLELYPKIHLQRTKPIQILDIMSQRRDQDDAQHER